MQKKLFPSVVYLVITASVICHSRQNLFPKRPHAKIPVFSLLLRVTGSWCTDKTPQVKNPQDKTPQTKPPKPKTPNTKTPKTKPPNNNYIRTKPPNIYLFAFIFGCCFVVYLVLGVSFKP